MHVIPVLFLPALLSQSAAHAGETKPGASEQAAVIAERGMPDKPSLAFRPVPFQLDTVVFNFPSGLRIMFQEDNTLPMVAVTTVFDAGSSDDPATEAGIAHVVEHAWFLSSQEGSSKVWTLQKSDMGCQLNAFPIIVLIFPIFPALINL